MEHNQADREPEIEDPVEFYPPVPTAPLLGPLGVILTLATFFYFFL
jgi:hypothetical protein